MYEHHVAVFVEVDEEGFEIEPIIFKLYDEEGNPVDIPHNLVPPNTYSLFKPKWDFEAKKWVEGDVDVAIREIKKMAKARLHAECTAYIEKGFMHNGNFYAFSIAKDQANFSQQMSYLLLRPDIKTVEWKTENNGKVVLTRDEFFSVCMAGEVWKRSNMSNEWDLEAYIDGLDDLDKLNNLGTFEEAVAKMKQDKASENQVAEQPEEPVVEDVTTDNSDVSPTPVSSDESVDTDAPATEEIVV